MSSKAVNHGTRRRACAWAAAGLLALVAGRAAASASESVVARGFKAEQAYDFHGIDNVNLFNGNLVATIPLGQTYQSNGTLSYAFTLGYNSSLWDWGQWSSLEALEIRIVNWYGQHYRRPDADDIPPALAGAEGYPGLAFNAGLGFRLSLGDLVPNLLEDGTPMLSYVGADGQRHDFWDTLHAGQGYGAGADGPGPWYSRDGSYLRLTRVAVNVRDVEFPDGTRQRFRCDNDPQRPGMPCEWLLRSFSDPEGDVLYVERTPRFRPAARPRSNPDPPPTWTWNFFEARGTDADVADPAPGTLQPYRSHRIVFELMGPFDDESARRPARLRLKSVDLAAPVNGANSAQRALFGFEYDETGIYRPIGHSWYSTDARDYIVPFNASRKVDVSLLRAVVLPAAAGRWAFDYWQPEPPSPRVSPVTFAGQTYYVSDVSGRLLRLKLPTGGAIAYDYGLYGFPQFGCPVPPLRSEVHKVFLATGVIKRQLLKLDGSNDGYAWLYQPGNYWDVTAACKVPKEFRTTSIDPLGNVQTHFFSIAVAGAEAPWDPAEHSLPLSKAESRVGPDGSTRWISTQTYKCARADFEGANVFDAVRRIVARNLRPGEVVQCGAPLRSSFVTYEWSALDDCVEGSLLPCKQANARRTSELVVYHDDDEGGEATFSDVQRSNFDGLGHYRTTVSDGNFGRRNFPADARSDRTTSVVDYNPGRSSVNLPGPLHPWVLETYGETQTRSATNAVVTRALFDFDSAGSPPHPRSLFLRARRTLKDADPGGDDLLSVFTRSFLGDGSVLVDQRDYGGDGGGLSTTALFAGGPDESYRVQSRQRYGNLEYSAYLRADGQELLRTVSNTLDPSSGLVLSSREASERSTTFTYDVLGRPLSVLPQGEAGMSYNYVAAGSGLPARIEVASPAGAAWDANGVGAGARYEFDGFGRPTLARERTAAGIVKRRTTYLPTGWKATESTALADAVPSEQFKDTRYQDYDAFGRATTILLPDNARTEVQYTGVRSVRRRVFGVETEPGSTSTVATFEDFDRQGRLVRLADYSDPGAASQDQTVRTLYDYDAAGRLLRVEQGQQTRLFAHDGRGFMTTETHPELGSTGQGSLRLSQFDARGHARRRFHPPGNDVFDLGFLFDRAERLTEVRQRARANRLLKTFQYYENNVNTCAEPAGWAAGKLEAATRFNYVPTPNATATEAAITVKEAYRYQGIGGRASERITSVSDGTRFTQAFGYDTFGNQTSLVYPSCLLGGCVAAGAPARSVGMRYDFGQLVEVPGFAPAIRYHASGLVREVLHANAVSDLQDGDASGLARPVSLRFSGQGLGRFGTPQVYEYDGAGNVTRLGDDWFAYDKVLRLAQAQVGGSRQDYHYDRWGNLLSISGAGTPQMISVSPATNRLSDNLTSYDVAGNLTRWGSPLQQGTYDATYEYDAFNRMTHASGRDLGKVFLYTADDERLATLDYKAEPAQTGGAMRTRETWTLRDLGKRVLRDFEKLDGVWSWKTDYVFRDAALLASVAPIAGGAETTHYHLDHLGTPRLLTSASGQRQAEHTYLPFGEEQTFPDGDSSRLRFTGHERDDNNRELGKQVGDLDFMHARMYNPLIGRFLSIDPLVSASGGSQGWNRYAYVASNPLGFTDPTGAARHEARIYHFDAATPPSDGGVPGTTYGGEIYVVTDDGAVHGPFSASSYPNSAEAGGASPYSGNQIDAGRHLFNNRKGHKGGSAPGLNFVNDQGLRLVPGTKVATGAPVTVKAANIHAGASDRGGTMSRGSRGCVTLCPTDAPAFFHNFDWSSGRNTGPSFGQYILFRGDGPATRHLRAVLIMAQRFEKRLHFFGVMPRW